jgi:squalene-associated FAD-dependent desaturase
MRRVAIIGGGYAGMAAAVSLAQQNIPVTVFEAAKQLGGRARRVDCHGLAIDNGQHILLGAYRETLRLIDVVTPDAAAAKTLLKFPLELVIPGHFRLRTAALPAPLHLALGLLSAQGITLTERLAALRFMLKMRHRHFCLAADTSVAALLQQHGQSERLQRLLWEPLCVAALNTPMQSASAQVFLNVLRDSLDGSRTDSDMLLPAVDLSALFPNLAATYVRLRGGSVHTSRAVRTITTTSDGFRVGMDDEETEFSHVVAAVAPQHLGRLTANIPAMAEVVSMLQNYSYQPIYSLYLQYPPQVRLSGPMLGLTDGLAQWVFDRGQTHNQPGLLAVVISAEGPHRTLPHDQLAERVQRELDCNIGPLPAPLWHQVIAEKRATFTCSPNLARPDQRTPLKGFYLAGDYTASPYPATLEAAVRSGVTCAEHILADE